MSRIDDGGPAFPGDEYLHSVNNEPVFAKMPGMSLRDYFAALAMASITISEVLEAFRRNDYPGKQEHKPYLPARDFDELAKFAYKQADAMLANRGGVA